MTGLLFAVCILPGCRELVAETGQVCEGCLSAFGDRLRPVAADVEPMTSAAIEDRDQAVRTAYQTQQTAAPNDPGQEWKQNQVCWLCEQRRRCGRTPQGWECASCQQVAG